MLPGHHLQGSAHWTPNVIVTETAGWVMDPKFAKHLARALIFLIFAIVAIIFLLIIGPDLPRLS
jgi:hypothetical protein